MKKEGKKDNKTLKKLIVNGLTLSRVAGTIAMPVLFNVLSAPAFIATIAAILFTDFLDGQLARKWEVSTIFGSVADMAADKLFGMALLLALSFTYPIMIIPLALELLIGKINIENVLKGNVAKSNLIGKGKMWVVGISITALLMIGAAPEIANSLSEINTDVNFFKEISNKIQEIFKFHSDYLTKISEIRDNSLSFIKTHLVNFSKYLMNLISNNKENIKNVVIPATILSETATVADYIKDYKKVKENERLYLIDELKKYREYLKKYKLKDYMKEVIFNEEYYNKTQEEPFVKKLMPNKDK